MPMQHADRNKTGERAICQSKHRYQGNILVDDIQRGQRNMPAEMTETNATY